MDYSAANTALWNFIIQMGLIAGAVILANVLRRKIALIRKGLMPIGVMAGLILLALKCVGIYRPDGVFLEMLVYHAFKKSLARESISVNDSSNPNFCSASLI